MSVPFKHFAGNVREVVQTVNYTGHTSGNSSTGVCNAITHSIAHSYLNGYLRFFRKLCKLVYKGNDEAVEVGTGYVLKMASRTNARIKGALYDSEIVVKRLAS